MMERFINIDNKIYSLKFGTKSLIQLKEFSKNISEPKELINLQFFLASQHNNISYEESQQILAKLISQTNINYVENLLSELLALSLKDYENIDFYFHIEELYRKAVGEMGMAPHIFYEMTPYEIDLAYKGYLDRIQLKSNCMIVAIRKAQDNKATLFNLLNEEKGWKEASLQERNEVFNALDI